MMKKHLIWSAIIAATSFSFSPITSANVVITGTRVIYNQSDREVTLKLDNSGEKPALVQVWADRGDAQVNPTQADAPFLITPPIFRINPNKGQTIRLIFSGEKLPTDRESVFWLNVLDIPPAVKNADSNSIQLAIRSRIKVFYRPNKLPGSLAEAETGLKWKFISQGKDLVLRATNNSAYHVSINYAAVSVNGKEYKTEGGMITPHGSEDFIIKDLKAKPASSDSTIKFESINDFGGTTTYSSNIAP